MRGRIEGEDGGHLDMRTFAAGAETNISFPVGNISFREGDPAGAMYVVQSGSIEMLVGDKVVDALGPKRGYGFMSMIDAAPRTSTARMKEFAEVPIIDQRRFQFMIDEIPNFASYVMKAMARRIRGLTTAI